MHCGQDMPNNVPSEAAWACRLTKSGEVVYIKIEETSSSGVRETRARTAPANLVGRGRVKVCCGDMHGGTKIVEDIFHEPVLSALVSTEDIKQFVFDIPSEGGEAIVHRAAKPTNVSNNKTEGRALDEDVLRASTSYSFIGVDLQPAKATDRVLHARMVCDETGEAISLMPVLVRIGQDSAVLLLDKRLPNELTIGDLATLSSGGALQGTQPAPPQLDNSYKQTGTHYELWVCMVDTDDNELEYPSLQQYQFACKLIVKGKTPRRRGFPYHDGRILKFDKHVEDAVRCEARGSRPFGLHYSGKWTALCNEMPMIMQKFVSPPSCLSDLTK